MGSQDWRSPEQITTEDLIRIYRGDDISIRAFSRESGIPYSTLQGIISGSTGRMSPTTRARIEDFLEHVPPIVRELSSPGRAHTASEERILWSEFALRNVEIPRGATDFHLVGRSGEPLPQVAAFPWRSLDIGHPVQLIGENGFNARALTRIVWGFRRGG